MAFVAESERDQLELPESRVPPRDRGATMMEYALIVSVVALVAIIGVAAFGEALSNLFEDFADAF